jgi:CO/xanthine dehydrogenase Mo-binding subunit
MIHVVTVRSPIPRGQLISVEVPHLPRGYRSISASDIPGSNRLPYPASEVPILAEKDLSYAGEPILLLAGPSKTVLDQLREDVKLSVDEEEPFLAYEKFSSDQVLQKRMATLGDPEMAFSVADHVVEGQYRTDTQEHWYPEPQGAYASFDYDKLVIRCATQWPFHVRDCVRSALDVMPEAIIVRPTPLGTHLDGRLWYPSILSTHAALAAFLCHKPARILLSREEDFRFTPKKARTFFSLRAAVDPSGGVSALDAQIVVNVGAYGPLSSEILEQTCLHAAGTLAISNLKIEGYAVRTNTLPLGAFSGLGAAPSFFASESLANLIARFRGEDPLDWRTRNVLAKGSLLITGEPLKEKTSFSAIAARLKTASDFARKHGSYELIRKRKSSSESEEAPRGIGIAFAYQGNGSVFSSLSSEAFTVEATLHKDLSLEIFTSAIAGDEGISSIWRATAARVLGIDEDKVRFAGNSTDKVPDSGPSILSRNIAVINRLIERCCVTIRSRRFRSPLPLSSKAVHRSRDPLVWENGKVHGYPFESLSYCGAVVEVELNLWSMEPRILGVWLCVDAGRIVSERYARRSLTTSTLAALGECLREKLDIVDGQITLATYQEYGLLSLSEAPPIEIDFLPGDASTSVRGIGELPFSCIPAAFAGAIAQASDLPTNRLPLRSEDLLVGMEES